MKKLLSIVLLISLAFTLTACAKQPVKNEKEIIIPILAEAAWLKEDASFINGVQMAVNDVNKEYGGQGYVVKSEIVDDQDLYEKGVEVATLVAKDPRVTAVFNLQNFDVSKTTADILQSGGKVTLFPYGAYDSLFAKESPYLFAGFPAFADLGKVMAAHAIEKGYKRIAIYHNGNQSQEELVTAFELALGKSGAKVVDYVPAIHSSNEFRQIADRWQALRVDGIVISQYGLDKAYDVLEMVRKENLTMPVLGEPIFNRVNTQAKYIGMTEGMAVPSTLVLEESKELSQFKARYREAYQKEADTWAVQGYDMLRMVADTAVKIGSTDPARIAEALHRPEGYQGVGRHIVFAKGGALVVDLKKLPMLTSRNGVFQ